MELNNEQKAIIEHTIKNYLFCGGSKDMDALCEAGLMECVGKKSKESVFVPDPYYRVTAAGKKAITPLR